MTKKRADRVDRLGKLLDELPDDRQRALENDPTLESRTRPRDRIARRPGRRKKERHT